MLTNTAFDLNNALVNVKINIKINAAEVMFMLTTLVN